MGLLYDAAGDVDKWRVFMEAATQVFNGNACHLLSFNPDTHQVHLNFNLFFGVTAEQIARFFEFFARHKETPMEELDLRLPIYHSDGQAMSCSELPDRTALERSELYQTLLHPAKCDYALSIRIPHEPPCYSVIGIMRGLDRGPYDAEDVAALNKLAPHFHRAIRLQKQLLEIDLQKRWNFLSNGNFCPV